jgi:exonuclease III
MRIAAWNIQNGGGKRIEGISRALSDAQSDVCVLSEYTNASSQRLTMALQGRGYEHILHTEPLESRESPVKGCIHVTSGRRSCGSRAELSTAEH